jgi:hypothetical protein
MKRVISSRIYIYMQVMIDYKKILNQISLSFTFLRVRVNISPLLL